MSTTPQHPYPHPVHRINTHTDLDSAIQSLIKLDPRLRTIHAGPVDLRRRAPGFEGLVWIITGQMISRHAADAIWTRTRDALGRIDAHTVLAQGHPPLLDAGQSRAKAAAITAAAQAVADGTLDFDRISTQTDEDAATDLLQIRGVGPWTAAMYLLACEGRPDVWPSGDVALHTAARRAELGDDVDALADRWRPWRAVAARMLWATFSRA